VDHGGGTVRTSFFVWHPGTRFASNPVEMTPLSRARYTVLVVDDDPSVLATYRRLLGRAGYRTLIEDDPRTVLKTENAASADLLLIDYKMPGMDGLSLLTRLRQMECRAPCVLISAFLNDEVRQRAKVLGVSRVLEKPVDVAQLRDVLADLLPITGSGPTALPGA
jgi:CheY-like chemotaxis protein